MTTQSCCTIFISDDCMGLVQYNSDPQPPREGAVNVRSRCAQMTSSPDQLSDSMIALAVDHRLIRWFRCAQMTSSTYGKTPFDRLLKITLERSAQSEHKCIFDADP